MNRAAETQLLLELEPRLRAAIPQLVPIVGADDPQELLQDGLVIALRLYRRTRAVGKKVTVGNLAFYTIRHLRSGRRSTGQRQNDVLHPAAQLRGHSQLQSLDQSLSNSDESGEPLTLHDCLAAPVEDPATSAARRLDWAMVLSALDPVATAILLAILEGKALALLGPQFKRSRTSLHNDQKRLGALVSEHLGQDILQEVQSRPAWRNDLSSEREKLACRIERRAA
jgi:hypothetical protein